MLLLSNNFYDLNIQIFWLYLVYNNRGRNVTQYKYFYILLILMYVNI